jgi:CheY-like chemotaxis protein
MIEGMQRSRVLIVDDNETNTKLAQYVLTSKGYDVRTAADAQEALSAIASFGPQLILMDLQLPGVDGLTLTRQLKADSTTKHIVIVATTAYAMKGDDERAFAAGCDGYITKPINTRMLASQVSGYLSVSRP